MRIFDLHRTSFLLCLLTIMSTTPINGQVTVEMERNGNVFSLPGKVNGLELNFIFDTGASDVYLSLAEAIFMVKNGYLSVEDITGRSYSQIANGEIVENTNVLLREVEIGGIKMSNVTASISNNINAPLLLGQSAIQKLGPIQLDGNKLIIKNGKEFNSDEVAHDCYIKGFQAIQANDYEAAISTLNKGLELTNNKILRSKLYGELASANYNLGDTLKAIKFCYLGISEDFMNEPLGYNLGVYLYEAGSIEESEKAFKLHISKFQDNASANKEILAYAFSYLGDIQNINGEILNAEISYKKSLQASANSMAYLGLGDIYSDQQQYNKAIENYEKGVAYEPNRISNVKRYYQLGLNYYLDSQFEKARAIFFKCQEVMEYNRNLYDYVMASNDQGSKQKYWELFLHAMGSDLWLARLSQSPQERISIYNKINSYPPIKAQLMAQDYIDLGFAYESLRDNNMAKETMIEASKLFPDNIDIMFLLSRFLAEDFNKINLLKKILQYEYKAKPRYFDFGTVYNNIAWSYCCLQKYSEGLPYAERAVALNPEHDNSWETIGELYFFLERYQDCIDAMTRCLSCDGVDQKKSALNFRGKSLIKLGKKSLGRKDLDAASKM